MPADALWTLAMAFNVYLTFFRKYNSEQLRQQEWKYLLFCYGLPFIPAFTYFFVKSSSRGRVYGSATVGEPHVPKNPSHELRRIDHSSGAGYLPRGTSYVSLSSMALSGSSYS